MMQRFRFSVMFAFSLLAAVSVAAPIPETIEYPKRRWAALSPEVRLVVESPDGRLWRHIESADAEAAERDPRGHIEKTFHAKSPYVTSWKPVLFDSAGRVWFEDGKGKLFGYDGKTWISPPPTGKEQYFSSPYELCATRGSFCSSELYASAGGITYITDQTGLHRFDGTTWTFEPGCRSPSISPDGKLAAARCTDCTAFKLYRDGKWELSDPIVKHQPQDVIASMIVENDGTIWVRQEYGRLRRYKFGKDVTDDTPAGLLKQVLDDLISPTKLKRDNAEAELGRLKMHLKEFLFDTLKKTQDAEVQLRLSRVLQGIAEPFVKDSSLPTFGPYTVPAVYGLVRDPKGRIYVAASILDDKLKATSGVIVREPDGSTFLLEGNDFAMIFSGHGGVFEQFYAVLTHDGDKAWVSRARLGKPPVLVDLKQRSATLELPDARHDFVVAVDREGRVFTSDYYRSEQPTRVMAFDPKQPDPRRKLVEVVPAPATTYDIGLTEYGELYGGVDERATSQFNFQRKAWEDLPDEQFVDPSRATARDPWRKVVRIVRGDLNDENRDPDFDPQNPYVAQLTHTVDERGNTWRASRDKGELEEVFAEGEGQGASVAEALAAAGFPLTHVRILGQVEGRKRILLSAWTKENQRAGTLFLAHLVEGKIRVHKVDRQPDIPPWFPTKTLLDAEGYLWLPSQTRSQHALERFETIDRYSCRIGVKGIVEQPKESGWPHLLDHAGNVWMTFAPGRDLNYDLRRGGKIVQQLTFPDTDCVLAVLSHRRGSVYALVSGGLLHMKADGPNFDRYVPAEFYELVGVAGRPRALLDVGQGWIIVQTVGLEGLGGIDNGYYAVKLPELGEPFSVGGKKSP